MASKIRVVITRVEIEHLDFPKGCQVGDIDQIIKRYICDRLGSAGMPIKGGPLLPEIDLSKGTLSRWEEENKGFIVYEFTFN